MTASRRSYWCTASFPSLAPNPLHTDTASLAARILGHAASIGLTVSVISLLAVKTATASARTSCRNCSARWSHLRREYRALHWGRTRVACRRRIVGYGARVMCGHRVSVRNFSRDVPIVTAQPSRFD